MISDEAAKKRSRDDANFANGEAGPRKTYKLSSRMYMCISMHAFQDDEEIMSSSQACKYVTMSHGS